MCLTEKFVIKTCDIIDIIYFVLFYLEKATFFTLSMFIFVFIIGKEIIITNFE